MKGLRINSYIFIFTIVVSVAWLAGCIQNDLPFPRIPQNIIAVSAVGESKQAYIDSIAFEVNLYLDETVDIENVSFSEYRITPGAT